MRLKVKRHILWNNVCAKKRKKLSTEQKMAKVCDICGKHVSVGNAISHAHNTTLRRWLPNLRHVRALVNGQVRRLTVCAKCLKAGKVLKAPHKARVKPPVEPATISAPAVEMPAVITTPAASFEPAAEMTSAV
jgi:large subunit ribosomal protein L28